MAALLISGRPRSGPRVARRGQRRRTAFFAPASTALLPMLVRPDRAAGGQRAARRSRSRPGSSSGPRWPACSSPAGAGVALAVDAGTFAVSAVFLVGAARPALTAARRSRSSSSARRLARVPRPRLGVGHRARRVDRRTCSPPATRCSARSRPSASSAAPGAWATIATCVRDRLGARRHLHPPPPGRAAAARRPARGVRLGRAVDPDRGPAATAVIAAAACFGRLRPDDLQRALGGHPQAQIPTESPRA